MNSVCVCVGGVCVHNHPLGNKPKTIKFGFILSSVEQLMIKSTSFAVFHVITAEGIMLNYQSSLIKFSMSFSSLASCLLHQPLLRSISRIFMVNAKREKILQHNHFNCLEYLHSLKRDHGKKILQDLLEYIKSLNIYQQNI